MKVWACELCDNQATLYCHSDSAFLCVRCDARVHQANFLVARHVRQSLCSICQGIADGDERRNPHPICSSCLPDTFSGDIDGDALSESDCSACISTNNSLSGTAATKDHRKSESSVTDGSGNVSNIPARFSGAMAKKMNMRRVRGRASRVVDAKAEGSFVNWCKMLGVDGNSAAVVSSASNALGFCLGRLASVPFRVCLPASFWFGLRLCGDRSVYTCQNLRRVEEVSGVPAKLILAVEAKLGSELRIRRARRDDLEEGWAEC